LRQKFNQLWRLFGTGLSFSVFGLGGLFIGVLLFPMVLIMYRGPAKRQTVARDVIGKSFGAFVWLMKSLGVLSYEIRGRRCAVPAPNCLIIANHPTLIDVVFLISMFPYADCVIKSALWHNPFTRGALTAANYIPNDGGADVIEKCTARLRDGATLILFPEGTRTRPNSPMQFKMGAAAIAVRANAQLLPVVISCEPLTLYKNDPWYNIPVRKPHFRFEILHSVLIEDLVPHEAGQRLKQRSLNQALTQLFRNHLGTAI
jgi:1-acyl-sn-glycerol-3-phosphate acyltransferase